MKKIQRIRKHKKVFNNKIKTSVIDRLKRQPFKVGLKGKELEEAVKRDKILLLDMNLIMLTLVLEML